jgi:hypothetical protein
MELRQTWHSNTYRLENNLITEWSAFGAALSSKESNDAALDTMKETIVIKVILTSCRPFPSLAR